MTDVDQLRRKSKRELARIILDMQTKLAQSPDDSNFMIQIYFKDPVLGWQELMTTYAEYPGSPQQALQWAASLIREMSKDG